MRAFFYDTWAFLALANRRDAGHAVAVEVDDWLERRGYAAATSDYVLDETLTGLQVMAGSAVALRFAELTEQRISGRELQLVELNRGRREQAMLRFRAMSPLEPRISFTDCTSFALMDELGIGLAFTADRHFRRASLQPLVEIDAGRLTARLPAT